MALYEIPWRQFPQIMLAGDEFAYQAGNTLADLITTYGASLPPEHDPCEPDSPMADFLAIQTAKAKGIGFVGLKWTQWSDKRL